MTGTPSDRVVLGKLVHAFIRAGWNPPAPSTRIMRHILEDMAEGRDPKRSDQSVTNATLDLSPQQRTALTLMATGMDGPKAAQAMGISHETIRTHLRKARDRLGAHTMAHAVAIALRLEIIDMPALPSRKRRAA